MEKPHFNIVLVEPEIPQNTGNIGRLCVGTNSTLHLVEPLGFDLSEKSVRRAGLDYWPHLQLKVHKSYKEFRDSVEENARLWFISKFGEQDVFHTKFQANDYLIFGKETKGLAQEIHESEDPNQFLQIPMYSENIRCLNLSNATAVVVYEAIRQIHIS